MKTIILALLLAACTPSEVAQITGQPAATAPTSAPAPTPVTGGTAVIAPACTAHCPFYLPHYIKLPDGTLATMTYTTHTSITTDFLRATTTGSAYPYAIETALEQYADLQHGRLDSGTIDFSYGYYAESFITTLHTFSGTRDEVFSPTY